MIIELDGRQMRDRAALYDHLQEKLELPEGCGRNLDALYDVLTERGTPVVFRLCAWTEAQQRLGGYAEALLETFRDAAENNPSLTIEIETDRDLSGPGGDIS